jgi:hypothetical protein
MTENGLTKSSNDMVDEVLEMLMKGFSTQSSEEELKRLTERGDFSNKDFEWLAERTRLAPDERPVMNLSDRQHKMRVKRTVIKAISTLYWANYFMDAFDEQEWQEVLPPMVISRIAFFSALRGGFDGAMEIAIGLDSGLNRRLLAETSGILKAEVRVSLVPNAEKITNVQSEIGMRLIDRMQEEAKRKKEAESPSRV